MAKERIILANDGIKPSGRKVLEAAGFRVDTQKRDMAALIREAPLFDVILIRSATKATSDVLKAGAEGKLKIVGRAGVGTDNVDSKTAAECGIFVANAPNGNTYTTAQLALTLMLNLATNVPPAYFSLKSGVWVKSAFEGTELLGKTLGIIGYGRIGQKLDSIVKSLGMEVIWFDAVGPEGNFTRDQSNRFRPLHELLAESDFVSIHTGGKNVIIGPEELALMKTGAFIINLSRGDNLETDAVLDALKKEKLAGAALDVHKGEPKTDGVKFTNPLIEHPNVIATPHLGASTKEAQDKTAKEMAEVVVSFLLRGDIINPVNMDMSMVSQDSNPTHNLFVHHLHIGGVFGKISDIIGNAGLNIRSLPSVQFAQRFTGETRTALTTFRLEGEHSVETVAPIIAEITKLEAVLRVTE
ncbi:hydroxyacid dehydrogenase [Candidatus Micrarchaeota archaeon]|nr:hydroxyacid dehydrogenase [Candidatus Micrarchaeota archaeon]